MKVDLAGWLRSNRNVYVGNATSVRDFRVQLRGNRSVILFGIYLIILIGASMVNYSTVLGTGETSVSDAQYALHHFYSQTMVLLGVAVCLIAPGLAATTVVAERQRQSLDLVFSAPVTPKYYLVGKMLSSFRYTWMVLILALPVTAASVILGGATWSDVVFAYLLLSLQGLMMTALALLISTLATKPVGAIIWSYIVAGLYAMVSGIVGETVRFGGGFGRMRDTGEQSWLSTLSPFGVTDTSRTYSVIGTHHIPNWVFATVFAMLVTKLCLLCAGAILNPSGSKEVAGLRIHILIYITVLAVIAGYSEYPGLVAYAAVPPASMYAGGSMTTGALPVTTAATSDTMATVSSQIGYAMSFLSGPIIVFLPFLACFGFDRERRYWPNGTFSVRRILDGTPAGGLPFLVAFMLLAFAGADLGIWLNGHVWLTTGYWEFALYIAGFWFFFWSVGRATSSFFGGLKAARALLLAAYLLIVALPFPFLSFTTGLVTESQGNRGAWNYYILSPLTLSESARASQAAPYGLILLIGGLVLAFYAEIRIRARVARSRKYDERSLQAT